MLTVRARTELRKVIRALKERGVSGYRMAKEGGFNRSNVAFVSRGRSLPVSDSMTRRVLVVIRDEAEKTGVDFPAEKFEKYLGHDATVAQRPGR